MSNSNALLCAKRFALGLLLFLTACSTGPRRATRDAMPPAVLSYDYVLGPVRDDAELDIEATPTTKNPAVHLRRAWLMLQRKRPAESVEACALVLYGPETPSLQAEAYGRYIRAQALAAMGKARNGNYDLKRASEIAMDQRLRDLIEDAMPDAAPEAAVRKNPVATAPQLDMHTRSEWQPAALIRSRLDPMGKIYRITVHHSAILLRSESERAAADQIRSIQNTHMKKEGCGDIGYHFLIDPSGRIWQGRELRYQGAHARGDNNRGNIGICVLGNFMKGRDGQRPTPAELEALEDLIANLSKKHAIAQDQIFCHSDLVNTQCPGTYLRTEVDRIARAAAAPARGRSAAAE